MTENRFFTVLPPHLQNDSNKKTSAPENILLEPEGFKFVEGQIGDQTSVTDREKARFPFLTQHDSDRQKTQLSTAVVYRDANGDIKDGVFYDDLLGHIESNGGIVTDPSKLFECDYYSFNPPIDIDKWTNFQKYYWTGFGTAKDFGEYVTKDYEGTQIVIHKVDTDGRTMIKIDVPVHLGSLPGSATVGDLIEDASSPNRIIYRWSGSAWTALQFTAIASLPATAAAGAYFYVCRVGYNYQRPVVFHYSASAGRYISLVPVMSVTIPDNPIEGMIWEDTRAAPARTFSVYKNGQWSPLTFSTATDFTNVSIPASGYYYDCRPIATVADQWSTSNWWIHINDLSGIDRDAYATDNAVRPIISFWQSIEGFSYTKPTTPAGVRIRNSSPLFNVYMYDGTTITGALDNFAGNTIFEYDSAQHKPDVVLGRDVSYDDTGDLLFKLTLETASYTKNNSPLLGYKFFKDRYTGLYHYVWTKSKTKLVFDPSERPVPQNLNNNPDHTLETAISRRVVIDHYRSVIQHNALGMPLGDNTYRWTDHNPVNGGVITDAEGSLMLNLITLFDERFDMANAIRSMGVEYSKFMKRFHRKLTTFWEDGSNVGPTGSLKSLSTADALDQILSLIFVNVDARRPFYNSDMGTFMHTVYQVDTPIMVPASTARTGATQPYIPTVVTYSSTEQYILGHDGSMVPVYGDDRDLVVLELENRFFARIPTNRQTETLSSSPLLRKNYFALERFVGNRAIITTQKPVNTIVSDYNTVVSPATGYRVYSTVHGKIATYDGTRWSTQPLIVGDKFINLTNSVTYIFNGFSAIALEDYNKTYGFDYSTNDFNAVVRKEFEKWHIDGGVDPATITFDESDKFSWNYGDTGLEGNWKGIYRRVYNTDRPHHCPWEILGYSIKPTWWVTVYPKSATVSGQDVWYSSNAMWADLKVGTLLTNAGIVFEPWQLLASDAPIPVDTSGVLLDPLSAGLVTLDMLNNRNHDWLYGDGSPAETAFIYSHQGRFALALAGYLMKPARFVEFLWSDFNFSIGDSSTVFGGEVQVSDNSFRRRNIASIKVHAATVGYSDMGINSWIAEYLTITGNTPALLASVIATSGVALGWQVNGFVNKTNTQLKTSSGVEIPFEDTFVVLHKSQPSSTLFYSGVNILKRGTVYQVYGYDFTRPYFNTLASVKATSGGQTHQDQTFTATQGQTTFNLTNFKIRNINDLSTISVLIDGFKIDSINYSVLNDSTMLLKTTVNAGQQVTVAVDTFVSATPYSAKSFKVGTTNYLYFDQPSTTVVSYNYGSEFSSPADVVQFLVEYQNYLSSLGFVFEGQNWVTVAGQFAAWAESAQPNQIFVGVASGNEIRLESDFGFVEDFKANQYGGYNILDVTGSPIEDFNAFRFDDELVVKSSEPIFGLRVVIKNYQHAVFLSNRTKFNDLIYDPFSGLRQKRLLVSTQKTKEWNGRLETPGYIITDTAAIPSLEKSVKDVSKLYNTVDSSMDQSKLAQSLTLYNFFNPQYMRDMGVSQSMAFDYHKRMIREKGTLRAMVAFSNAKSNSEPLEVRECWAWKLGDFGQDRIDYAEVAVHGEDFTKKYQTFIFGNTPETETDVAIKDYNIDTTHWLKKPKTNNLKFPDPASDVNLIVNVLENGTIWERLFLFDPAKGFVEPAAMGQIDIKSGYDPAYYTSGNKVYPGYEWSANQVGTIWWDTINLEYEDYASDSLTFDQSAELWGKLKSYSIGAITISGDEYTVTLNKVHDLVTSDVITISLNDDSGQYKAYIVDVPASNQITFSILLGPSGGVVTVGDNYFKFNNVTKADVAVYQWVESVYDPITYLSKNNGVSLRYAAVPSFSLRYENGVPLYSFWVRGITGLLGNKTLSIVDIERRLSAPSNILIPWFAIKGDDKLILDATSLNQRTGLSLEISIEPLNFERNNQWLMVAEYDDTNPVPALIVNKLIDSLSLVDAYDHALPYIVSEPFGVLHGQVMYPDTAKAQATFLEAINETFKAIYRYNVTEFVQVFDTDATWWTTSDYDVIGYTPSQYVQLASELDDLIDVKEGDAVQVKRARLVNSVYLSDVYKFTDGEWVLVQAKDGSVVFNDTFFGSMRTALPLILSAIPVDKANNLVFTMIYEMLIQNPSCDWLFKTSFIDVRNFVDNTTYSVKPIDSGETIFQNINDVKPYSTKLRDLITTHNIFSDNFAFEEADTSVTEDFETKLTMYADRLSCNLFDDSTYDFAPYDTEPYDTALWDRDLIATADWTTLQTFTSASTTTYPITKSSNRLLDYRIITTGPDGNTVNTPLYTVKFDRMDMVTVEFTNVPPINHTFNLQVSSGEASPSLTASLVLDEDFSSIDSTYEHAAAVVRATVIGVYNDRVVKASQASEFSGCSNTDVVDGGNSEERVRTASADRLSIRTTTEYTPLFSGYDAAPYDLCETRYDYQVDYLPPISYRFEVNDNYPSVNFTDVCPLTVDHVVSPGNINTRIITSGNYRRIVTQVDLIHSGVTTTLVNGLDYTMSNANAITLKANIFDGDTVRLYIGKFITLAKRFNVTVKPVANYVIHGNTVTIIGTPTAGDSITCEYEDEAVYDFLSGSAIMGDQSYIVSDKVATVVNMKSNLLTSAYTCIDDTDKQIKQYNPGTGLFDNIGRSTGVPYFVESAQAFYTFNGSTWGVGYIVGDYPLLAYDWNGKTTSVLFETVTSDCPPLGGYLFEGDDTLSAHGGAALNSGAAGVTEGNDTAAATANLLLQASASITEAPDQVSATSMLKLQGLVFSTEANDSLVAIGESGSTSFITEADDTLVATSTITVSDVVTIVEADDTVTSTSTLKLQAASAVTEAADTILSSIAHRAFATAPGLVMWSTTDKTPQATLSGTPAADVIVSSSVNPNFARGRGSISVTKGKWFLEWTINTLSGGAGSSTMGIGFAKNSWNMSGNILSYLGDDTTGFGVFDDAIYYNGNPIGTIGQYRMGAAGQTSCMVFDFDNDLIWIKRNNGFWNVDASADPATGVGGVSVPIGAGPWYPAFELDGASDQLTVNFTMSTFYTVPTGVNTFDNASMIEADDTVTATSTIT